MASILELGEDLGGGGCVERANGDGDRGVGAGAGAALGTVRPAPGRRYRVFDAAPQDPRGMPAKKPVADYFLVSLGRSIALFLHSCCCFFAVADFFFLLSESFDLSSYQNTG